MSTPFGGQQPGDAAAGGGAAPQHAAGGAGEQAHSPPVTMPGTAHTADEHSNAAHTDIYRTFSPSDCAFWDLNAGKGGGGDAPSGLQPQPSGGLLSRVFTFFGAGGPK